MNAVRANPAASPAESPVTECAHWKAVAAIAVADRERARVQLSDAQDVFEMRLNEARLHAEQLEARVSRAATDSAYFARKFRLEAAAKIEAQELTRAAARAAELTERALRTHAFRILSLERQAAKFAHCVPVAAHDDMRTRLEAQVAEQMSLVSDLS